MKKLLTLLCCLLLPGAAFASPLVADLSTYRIDIDAGFTGARIFLFGTRNDNGDIIVVARGPEKKFVIRKKERIAGIWVNGDYMSFRGIPDFYSVAASKPLDQIKAGPVFQQLRIGTDTLLTPPKNPDLLPKFTMFSEALLRNQALRKLYPAETQKIEFMGETLFKTELKFPDTIPKGDYTAEIYLVSDGEVIGMQSIPIRVAKSGFDAFISDYAHNSPLLYGISAIVIALAAGWGAGRLFQRF